MKDSQAIESALKSQGFKLTRVRLALINLFMILRRPLSVLEIKTNLAKKGLSPNKTTVYRQLAFLKNQGIIVEINLADDNKRYEASWGNHHHHLVCIRCQTIQDVTLLHELKQEEKRITKMSRFKILNHSLEFFGLCARCK
ncbi:transcriptional repressor [Candidatus Woesebacteria bacterium]|nr:transcriptional repressor [Candidatus Woesebacteria bacterium]